MELLYGWIYDDGGRSAAGYKGAAGDCVVRAIAIATETPYQTVYDALSEVIRADPACQKQKKRSVRDGAPTRLTRAYLAALGWQWHPTMGIGTGCRVHLRADELPGGRIIARCSRHLVAVIHGVCHDTFDASREGTRCVYGYWTKPNLSPRSQP